MGGNPEAIATDRQRDIARARRIVLTFVSQFQGTESQAIKWINERHAAAALPPQLAAALQRARDGSCGVRKSGCALTRSTLNNWKTYKAQRGTLISRRGGRALKVKPWHALALELRRKPQGVSYQYIAQQLHAKLGRQAPSYYQVRRFFREKFSAIDQLVGRHTGSALSAHKRTLYRTSAGMWPMDEVHADGWNTHFVAPHPQSGDFVTYEIWHFHDVRTRFVFPPSIGLSESFVVIKKGLENCVRVGGVPAIWQTDSTGSVKNDRMEFDPITSIKDRAGFEIVHPKVGNSQANGICENFNRYLDARAKELATFRGKGMDSWTQKKVAKLTEKMVKAATREERDKLRRDAERIGKGIVFDSYDEAAEWIVRVHAEFNDRPHRALPKVRDEATGKRRHQTPREAWQQALGEGWQPVMLTEPDLVDLFRPHERKKVQRGAVRLHGQTYSSAALEHYNGDEVLVAYDIMDGSKVWVKNLKGQLLMEVPFYSARTYRQRSFMEMALEKRADKQLERLQQKADKIEGQRPTQLIEHQPADILPFTISQPQIDVEPAAIPAAEPANARPMFDSDAAQYRWLLAHTDRWTDHDRTWIEDYRFSSEYADIFGDEEGQGFEVAASE